MDYIELAENWKDAYEKSDVDEALTRIEAQIFENLRAAWNTFFEPAAESVEELQYILLNRQDSIAEDSGEAEITFYRWIQKMFRKAYSLKTMNWLFNIISYEAELDRVREILLPRIEKDPAAFCSAGEFQTAFDHLKGGN